MYVNAGTQRRENRHKRAAVGQDTYRQALTPLVDSTQALGLEENGGQEKGRKDADESKNEGSR